MDYREMSASNNNIAASKRGAGYAKEEDLAIARAYIEVTHLPRGRPAPAVFLDVLVGAGRQHLLYPAIGGQVLDDIVIRVHGRALHCACGRCRSDREVPGANSKS